MSEDPFTLSKWQCRQQVWAEKIVNVKFNHIADSHISWSLENGDTVVVSDDLLCRGTSTPIGGYYILYANGYESWCPADVFEAGYAKIK